MVTVLPPSNYDDAGMLIRVDPGNIYFHAEDMPAEANVIGDAIDAIAGIWNKQLLRWQGGTADEAQDYLDRWNHAIGRLFGTKDDPESGAFQKMAGGVAMAGGNFGEAEDTVVKMFQSLADGVNPPSEGPPSPPLPPTRNQGQGPITETAPAPP